MQDRLLKELQSLTRRLKNEPIKAYPIKPAEDTVNVLFRCPSTGEANCRKCTGEYCEVHFNRPCDCDVLQRHGL